MLVNILKALQLNQQGILAWDDTLYIIESVVRAEAGLDGMRAYRDESGVLHADFLDNPRIYAD